MAPTLYPAPLIINGKQYLVANDGYTREQVQVQGADAAQDFEFIIENYAMGWGSSKYMEPGTYDYADTALLHKRLSFLPGAVAVEYTPGGSNQPEGHGSFCEFWDGDDANRRLIIVTPRHVYEINPAGALTSVDMTGLLSPGVTMTKGVRYRHTGGDAKVYIAVQNGDANDYFVTRDAAATYTLTDSLKVAQALGVARDSTGAPVLWRADENGELNQSVAAADPEDAGSWAGASYPTGEGSVRVNDIFQQGQRMLVARPDGVWSFDGNGHAVPITPGMEMFKDQRNGFFVKDWNGMAIVPTVAGLIWVDGLEWDMVGPVSTSPDARNLRGRETAFAAAGDQGYCSVVFDGNTYIFHGRPRNENRAAIGNGMFVWHGPIAVLEFTEVGDLWVSTVWEKKLWWAADQKFGAIPLDDTFAPVAAATEGFIYFPEGFLDLGNPAIFKEVKSVEYIAPASLPLANGSNEWEMEIDFGEGFTSPGVGDNGVYQKVVFSSQNQSRRPIGRLRYLSDGDPECELEQVIIRGKMYPEWEWRRTFRIVAFERNRNMRGQPLYREPETQFEDLVEMSQPWASWNTTISWGADSFEGRIARVTENAQFAGMFQEPTRSFDVEIVEVG